MSYVIASDFPPELVGELVERRGQDYEGVCDSYDSHKDRVGFDAEYSRVRVSEAGNCLQVWESGEEIVKEVNQSYILVTDAARDFVMECVNHFNSDLLFMGDFGMGEPAPNYWIKVHEGEAEACAEKLVRTIINSYQNIGENRKARCFFPQAKLVFASWQDIGFLQSD